MVSWKEIPLTPFFMLFFVKKSIGKKNFILFTFLDTFFVKKGVNLKNLITNMNKTYFLKPKVLIQFVKVFFWGGRPF
jgi:hypothetical protein